MYYIVWCFETCSYNQSEEQAINITASAPEEAAVKWCRINKETDGHADVAVKDMFTGKIRSYDIIMRAEVIETCFGPAKKQRDENSRISSNILRKAQRIMRK